MMFGKKLEILPEHYQNVEKLENDLRTKSEGYWQKKGENRALELFHLMALRVPAYKDFLKKNNIKPSLIKSIKDFNKLPTLDKNNYLRFYPINMLCWDGNFDKKRWTISTNSGSTGETYYFPRMLEQDLQYSVTAELYLRNNFDIQHRSTLYIDSFAMGAWIGGVFTYEAIRLLAERGKYNISIITPGIFKEEIIKAVKNLGPNFDQVIIGGYPPFIKDIIDEGIKSGIDWKKRKIGIVFSAEGFTEKFRDYLYERIGVDNPYLASLNHYGTADMGTMSHETPLSILVRRKAIENKKLCESIFSLNNRTPTFTQYDPTLFFFQKTNDILCCSGYSGIPFIRYDFKDNGGIYTISEIEQKFNDIGMNLNEEIKQAKISNTIWNIPFVYVFERNDFTVKLYGANIFPETIRHALQQKRFEKYVTGKFTMYINFDEDQNQFLEINIELMKGIDIQEELADKIQKAIVVRLLEENSEYKSNYRSNPPRQTPKIDLWTYEDPNFFRPGGKQKWIKK